MNARIKELRTSTSRGAMKWFLLLAAIGLTDSAYLTWGKLTNSKLVCLTGSGCDQVSASPYAYLLGIPVAYFGLAMYLTLFVSMLYLYTKSNLRKDIRAGITTAIMAINIAGALFSAYLIWLSVTVIGATCNWCVLSATVTWILVPFSYRITNTIEP